MNRVQGKPADLPDPLGYSILFDSTRWQATLEGKLGKCKALPIPGTDRDMVLGKGLLYGVMPMDKTVTVYSAVLKDGNWYTIQQVTLAPNVWRSFYFIPQYYDSNDAIVYIRNDNPKKIKKMISVIAWEDY